VGNTQAAKVSTQTGLQIANVSTSQLKVIAKYGRGVLVASMLTYEACQQIHAWWKGEITGKRCAKNVVDSMGSLACGVAGGELGGIALGAMTGGPIGMVAGMVLGGLAGSMAGASLMDRLTQELFDLPKDIALENAYSFLEVHHSASNE